MSIAFEVVKWGLGLTIGILILGVIEIAIFVLLYEILKKFFDF